MSGITRSFIYCTSLLRFKKPRDNCNCIKICKHTAYKNSQLVVYDPHNEIVKNNQKQNKKKFKCEFTNTYNKENECKCLHKCSANESALETIFNNNFTK